MRRTADRTTTRAPGEALRRAVLLVAALATVVALAGCSGGDEEPNDADSGPGSSRASSVETDAKLGAVRGRISDAKASRALDQVTAVVERWLDRGYGGDYPRKAFGAAFGDFTKDARRLARKQKAVMSNAKVGGRVESVDVRKRVVRVDLAAPKGKPAGATARFRLKIVLSGGVDRTDVVSGRLLMTPAKDGWKVFGFDVKRGARA